jgi:fructokinase
MAYGQVSLWVFLELLALADARSGPSLPRRVDDERLIHLQILAMKPNIIGIGEVLWDLLPTGARMGGAPANFACHASALGAESSVISRVGKDPLGQRLLEKIEALGVSTRGISVDPIHPTGTVDVKLGPDGQPEFLIASEVAWDHMEPSPDLLRMAADADAVCFGSLGQRSPASRRAIRQLVAATSPKALRVFDVNLRQDHFSATILDHSLELANVCKLSDSELPVLAKALGLGGDTPGQLRELQARYLLRMVVFTRGGSGSILTDGNQWCENPGVPTEVNDTIGAGDSFTCAVVMGMLQGWPIERISDTANQLAAFVCSQDGAVPELPQALRDRFLRSVDL